MAGVAAGTVECGVSRFRRAWHRPRRLLNPATAIHKPPDSRRTTRGVRLDHEVIEEPRNPCGVEVDRGVNRRQVFREVFLIGRSNLRHAQNEHVSVLADDSERQMAAHILPQSSCSHR